MSHLSVTQLRDQAFLPLCLVSSTSVHMTTSGQTTSVKPETTMESSFSVSPNASRPVSQDSFRYSVLRPEPRPSRANLTDAAIGPDRSRPDGNPLLFEEAPLQSPPCFTTRDMNPCRLSKPRPTRHQATSLQAVRRNVSARMHGEPALDDSWVERVREESDWCRSQLDELPTLFEASVKTIRRLESYNVDAYKEHRAEKARLKSDTEMGLFQDHNTILRSSDLGSLFPTPRLHLGTPCSHLPLQSESRIVTLFSELHSNVSITLTKFLEQSDAKKTKWLAKLTPKLYKTSPSNYRAILVILAAENCRRMEQRLLAVKTLWSLASDVVQTDRNGCWSVVEKVHKVLPGFAIDATLKLSNDCAPFRGLGALQTPLLPAQEPSTLVWDMTIPWKQTGIAAVDSSLTAKDLQMHMTNTSACYSQAALYSHFNGRTLYPVGVTDEQFCSRGPAFNLMASPHRKDNAFERLQQAVFLGVTVVVRHLRYLGLGQVNDAVEAILAKQDDLLLLTARSRLDDYFQEEKWMSLANDICRSAFSVLSELRSYYSFPRKTIDGWRRMSIESWLKRVFRSSDADAVEMLDTLSHLCMPDRQLLASCATNRSPESMLGAELTGKTLLTYWTDTTEGMRGAGSMGNALLTDSTETADSKLDLPDPRSPPIALTEDGRVTSLSALDMDNTQQKSHSPPLPSGPSSALDMDNTQQKSHSPPLPSGPSLDMDYTQQKSHSPSRPNSPSLEFTEATPKGSPVFLRSASHNSHTTSDAQGEDDVRAEDRCVENNDEDPLLETPRRSQCVLQ